MAITDPPEQAYERDELECKTVVQLRELAAEHDVELPSGATKAEIVDRILEAQDEQPAERDEEEDEGASPRADESGQEGAHFDQRGREADDGLGSAQDTITRTIEDPPSSSSPIRSTDERTMRVSADNIQDAPTDQWVTFVEQGEGGQGDVNVQAAVVLEPIFLEYGDPEEVKLSPGDYIVRDGNGDLHPVSKGDFAERYAKPETDVPDKEVQQHPAVQVLAKTIQLIVERPGDANNPAQIYAWADEAGVDLRDHVAAGSSEKP